MSFDLPDFLAKDDYKNSRPHPIGRPPKLTSEMIEQICDLLIQGKSIARAATITGISESTIHRWLAHGKSKGAEPIFIELVQRVKEAVECSEFELIQNLRNAGRDPKNWRAIAWMLERRFPEQYGKERNPQISDSTLRQGPDTPPNLAIVN